MSEQRSPTQTTSERTSSNVGLWVMGLVLLALVFGGSLAADFVSDRPSLQTWSTVLVSIVVQAIPFLVFGVLLSAALVAFVPTTFFQRALPRRQGAAVPVAAMSGAILPGCECASVPVSSGLMARGVAPSAALAFLLSAPAINPIVIISTVVAFPGRPEMAVARFFASLMVAMTVGWIWLKFGRTEWLRMPKRDHLGDARGWEAFRRSATHDFLHAGGFLIVGGLTAATMNVFIPRGWLELISDNPWIGVLALALLAVVLSICSEADAFVAASLTSFSATAQLAFMVVGPMVDLKLISLQVGIFGKAFAAHFAPLTFVVAVTGASITGVLLL